MPDVGDFRRGWRLRADVAAADLLRPDHLPALAHAQYMPRVKPAKLEASAAPPSPGPTSPGSRKRRRSCRRSSTLRHPKRFHRLGARVPEGNPPLRTLRHRQDAAGEGGRQGVGGEVLLAERLGVRRDVRRPRRLRIRKLFEEARKNAPAIVFIDELDAVVPRARAAASTASTTRRSTSCSSSSTASTSRRRCRDRRLEPARGSRPALLGLAGSTARSSSRHADLAGREAILSVHTRGKPLAPTST